MLPNYFYVAFFYEENFLPIYFYVLDYIGEKSCW